MLLMFPIVNTRSNMTSDCSVFSFSCSALPCRTVSQMRKSALCGSVLAKSGSGTPKMRDYALTAESGMVLFTALWLFFGNLWMKKYVDCFLTARTLHDCSWWDQLMVWLRDLDPWDQTFQTVVYFRALSHIDWRQDYTCYVHRFKWLTESGGCSEKCKRREEIFKRGKETEMTTFVFANNSPRINSHCSLPRDLSGWTSRSSILPWDLSC